MDMDRRQFMYAIGSTAAAITGWLLLPNCSGAELLNKETGIDYCPKLTHDIILREVSGGGEILQNDHHGNSVVVCHVNDYGLQVLKTLDGEHSIKDLAHILHRGFGPAKLEHTEASVASFLAMLAQGGLLKEPFYVNIHAVEMTA